MIIEAQSPKRLKDGSWVGPKHKAYAGTGTTFGVFLSLPGLDHIAAVQAEIGDALDDRQSIYVACGDGPEDAARDNRRDPDNPRVDARTQLIKAARFEAYTRGLDVTIAEVPDADFTVEIAQ